MRKILRSFLVGLVLANLALAQTPAAPTTDTAAIASEALSIARAGNTHGALDTYRRLLNLEPDNSALLRDYAVILSWDGNYKEAVPVARRVRNLQKDQPDWALRDFAGIYLFGDALPEALDTLNELIARGDTTEQTLLRKALALRWLGQTEKARVAYRRVLEEYPDSAESLAGLAYTLADEGKLSEALECLDSDRNVSPRASQVLRARVRILNWMGRHLEAQRLIASLPSDLKEDREILEDKVAAARWGGDPKAAMVDLYHLVTLFPSDANRRMSNELRTEYGHFISPGFRFSKDVDGLVERSLGNDASFHLNPAHVIRAGYQYRWLEQQHEQRTLVRYEVGWNGTVGRRVSFYTTLASVDYRVAGLDRKLAGDGSAEVVLSDTMRLSTGGGTIVVDAYQAIAKQVTASFGFGYFSFAPNASNRVQAKYARYLFSDDVVRDRLDFDFSRTILAESGVRLKAGWRSNLMWHEAQTADFFSPSSFQSHLAVAQAYGPIASWLEISGEIAAGWQREPGIPVLHPFQMSGGLVFHPTRYWRTTVSAGKSTSSLDRVIPGQKPYSRWTAGANMEFRFP